MNKLWKAASTIKLKASIFIPDIIYVKQQYRHHIGKNLDLKNPITYNEKLQWLKLYDHNPIYPILVDKFAVRKYVEDRIGRDYLIPLCGGPWKCFSDIEFSSLPDSFVLKCTHDSGGLVICKDKSKIDMSKTKKIINSSLKRNYFYKYREWAYKNVPRRIIAETYIGSKDAVPNDYKFFCFDGKPMFLYVATDRFVDTKVDFYDLDFNKIQLQQDYKNSDITIKKPKNYDFMVELAKKLAKDLRHVRVDFYNIDGKIYFGELTLYSFAGLQKFQPEVYDELFGSYLHIGDMS